MHLPRTSVRRILAWVAPLCILPIALTACSSSSTSPTTTAAEAGRTLCTTVPPSLIAATTGLTVSPATSVSTKTTLTCTYKAADPSKSVIILYAVGVTTADFEAQAKKANSEHGPITAVKHLGSAAYYFTVPAQDVTITTLVIVHGQAQIVITSTASITKLADLGQNILSNIASKE